MYVFANDYLNIISAVLAVVASFKIAGCPLDSSHALSQLAETVHHREVSASVHTWFFTLYYINCIVTEELLRILLSHTHCSPSWTLMYRQESGLFAGQSSAEQDETQ